MHGVHNVRVMSLALFFIALALVASLAQGKIYFKGESYHQKNSQEESWCDAIASISHFPLPFAPLCPAHWLPRRFQSLRTENFNDKDWQKRWVVPTAWKDKVGVG